MQRCIIMPDTGTDFKTKQSTTQRVHLRHAEGSHLLEFDFGRADFKVSSLSAEMWKLPMAPVNHASASFPAPNPADEGTWKQSATEVPSHEVLSPERQVLSQETRLQTWAWLSWGFSMWPRARHPPVSWLPHQSGDSLEALGKLQWAKCSLKLRSIVNMLNIISVTTWVTNKTSRTSSVLSPRNSWP